MLKVLSVALTTDYLAIGTGIAAFSGLPYGPGRTLRNGLIKNAGANPIRVSLGSVIVPPVGNDDVSILLAAGDFVPFDEINMSAVFAKTTTSTSTIEIYGEE